MASPYRQDAGQAGDGSDRDARPLVVISPPLPVPAFASTFSARRTLLSRFRQIRLYFFRPHVIEVGLLAVCIFLLTSPFTFFLMGEDPTAPAARDVVTMRREAGSQLMVYALRVLVFAIAVFAALQRWRQTGRDLPRMLPIVWFPAWALLSAFWSDSFSTSMNAGLALTLLMATGFLIGVRMPLHLAARAVLYSGSIMAVLSLVTSLFYPAYGQHQATDVAQTVHAGAWRGVYLHKNHFGQLCAIYLAAVLVAGRWVMPSRVHRWALAGLLVFLIIRSSSASAVALIPLALLLSWLLVVLGNIEKALAFAAAAVGGVIAVISASVLLAMLGRDATLTGRTEVWALAVEYILRQPMLGYGYGSGFYGGFVVDVGREVGVYDPHNGYLDVLLGTGAIGLVLFMVGIVAAWAVARGVYRFGGSYSGGALVLATVVNAYLVAALTEAIIRPLGATPGIGLCALGMLLAAPRSAKIGARRSHALRQQIASTAAGRSDSPGAQT